MRKKGQLNVRDFIRSIFALFIGIIILSALAPIVKESVVGFSSFFIGFAIFMVIIAFILQVLNELGVNI